MCDDNPTETIDDTPISLQFIPHKIFINHVDSYHAKYFAPFIVEQLQGMLAVQRNAPPAGETEEKPEPVMPEGEGAPPTIVYNNYEVVGTLSESFSVPPSGVSKILDENNVEEFEKELLECSVVIYDVSTKETEIPKALKSLRLLEQKLQEAEDIGPKTLQHFSSIRMFILISKVITWAKTRPLNPYPDKLQTFVLCVGLTYGYEEEDLEFYFKKAWMNEILPIFGNGLNFLPFLHIDDLIKILYYLIELKPPSPQYILGVEATSSLQDTLIKAIAKELGNGFTIKSTPVEAFLYTNMTQTIYEDMTLNLPMEPAFVLDVLNMGYKSELNIADNMKEIVEEFRKARNLIPKKIVMHGPPCTGKTMLSRKICEYYNLRYVSLRSIIDENIDELETRLKMVYLLRAEKAENDANVQNMEEGEENVEEEEDDTGAIKALLLEFRQMKEVMDLDEKEIIKLFKDHLSKNFTKNQGYVLDDFPKTIEEAIELFGPLAGTIMPQEEGGGGGEGEGAEPLGPDMVILPTLIISLLADDKYIKNRLYDMVEEEVEGMDPGDELDARLIDFKAMNREDITVINYYDQQDVDILLLDITTDSTRQLLNTFKCIVEKMGPPVNIGLTRAELEELEKIEKQEKALQEEKGELECAIWNKTMDEEHTEKLNHWLETYEKLRLEEENIFITNSEPLRHYLMKHVFPMLSKALIDVVQEKPRDPIDYLAEHLFNMNNEGTIFDDAVCYEGEDTYETFRHHLDNNLNIERELT